MGFCLQQMSYCIASDFDYVLWISVFNKHLVLLDPDYDNVLWISVFNIELLVLLAPDYGHVLLVTVFSKHLLVLLDPDNCGHVLWASSSTNTFLYCWLLIVAMFYGQVSSTGPIL